MRNPLHTVVLVHTSKGQPLEVRSRMYVVCQIVSADSTLTHAYRNTSILPISLASISLARWDMRISLSLASQCHIKRWVSSMTLTGP
jgi:hypothetical protein